MMTASKIETGLVQRLERFTGEDGSCCIPEYQRKGAELRKLRNFPIALARIKALADENRLLAASLLKRSGELCACEIQAASGLTHATVSHHMGVLLGAGLVTAQRKGKWTYYKLAKAGEVGIP